MLVVGGGCPPPGGAPLIAANVPSGERSGCHGNPAPGAVQSGIPPAAGTATKVLLYSSSPITVPEADRLISRNLGGDPPPNLKVVINCTDGSEYTLSCFEVN